MNTKTSETSSSKSSSTVTDGTSAASNNLPKHVAQNAIAPNHDLPSTKPTESGGQAGLDPTRYGDWEKKGRCTDF